MFWGLFAAPPAVIGTVAVYDPAASAPVVAESVTVAGVVPPLIDVVSHQVAPAP